MQNLRFDWNKIESDPNYYLQEVSPDFQWGVASAAHQVEGNNIQNQWYWWENKTIGTICHDKSGSADNQWDIKQFKEDINLIKEMGTDTYRLSVEWSRIEPVPGTIDKAAVQNYRDMIQALIYNEITPIITLYHFSLPMWFFEKGQFLKEDNISYFENFCGYISKELGDIVSLWATSNEVNGQAVTQFLSGNSPNQGKGLGNFIDYTKNVMDAHVRCYNKIKESKYESKVGFIINILQIESANKYNFITRVFFHSINQMYRGIYYDFFRTGKWNWTIYSHYNSEAVNSLDWWGVNYYYHATFDIKKCIMNLDVFKDIKKCTTLLPGETKTDFDNMPVYPEGLYRALIEARQLNKPIIITETGAPDRGDEIRREWIKKYLYAVKRYMYEYGDDHNLHGFIYWALLDNFEWDMGYTQKFGLYKVDFDNQKRTLKDSAKYYQNAIKYSRNLQNNN